MALESRQTFIPRGTPSRTHGLSLQVRCRHLTTAIRATALLAALTCFSAVAHSQSLVAIDYPGATSTDATGVNNSGQIVGNYHIGNISHGFVYTGGTFSSLTVPGYVPGTTVSYFGGISDSGQIVGWYFNPVVTTAFLYNNGAFTSINFPGASATRPAGISGNSAYIVGFYDLGGHTRGFLYTGGVFTGIDCPGAENTIPYGVNNKGEITGYCGTAATGNQGFLYKNGVFTSLAAPGWKLSQAFAINNSGTILGQRNSDASGFHLFLYDAGVFTNFDISNGGGFGINDNGAIVGYYVDAAHVQHAFLYSVGAQGYINPKYMILGVTYAPPGSQSSVTYTDSALVGNSSTIKSSFTDQTSLTASVSISGKIPGYAKGTVTGTFTNVYGQTSSSSNMVTINKTTQVSNKTQGPSNSLTGVNHDYDVIWLWLNPVLPLNANVIDPNAITWNGYGYDATDQPGLDILPVFVGWLNGDIAVPSNVAAALARTWASGYLWAPGQGPGLTGPGPGTDFATIVESDPFWQCSQMPGNCPAAVDLTRFTLSANQNVVYEQAPPGGQPITQTYQLQYQNTSVQGQGTSSTRQQTFGLDVQLSQGPFWESLSESFRASQTFIWTTSVDTSITKTTTSVALASITGPTCTVNTSGNTCNQQYTGPVEFEIYQDNQYGTFLFFPVSGSSSPLSMPTSTSLPIAVSGLPYGPVLLTATGGSGTGYTWCVQSGAACGQSGPPLPTGFTLGSTGSCGTACTNVALSSTGTPAAAVGSYSFTVQVRDSAGNVATQPITLGIALAPPSITTQPANKTIPSGTTANLNVTASGTALSYQWYLGTSPSTMNPIAGATTSSYTSPALTVTTSYWVQVSNGAGPTNSNTATITLNLPKHDFNHDGKADILLRDGAGGVYLWMMDGYTVTNRFIASIWNGWAIVGTGDFNGDGKADILWKDSAGNMAIWLMDGSVVSSYSSIGNIPTSSTVSGVADFNGDGRTDIVWRDTDGNVFMWVMDGYTVTNRFIASIWNGWAIVGTGDFNGDGKADILWKDSAGNMAIWLMDGSVVSSYSSIGNIPMSSTVSGVADFNGDSRTDILWRDTDGNVFMWVMDGYTVTNRFIASIWNGWAIIGAEDFNGDGKADILWKDSAGNMAIWLMDGPVISSFAAVGNLADRTPQ